jgi:hypothetical protein
MHTKGTCRHCTPPVYQLFLRCTLPLQFSLPPSPSPPSLLPLVFSLLSPSPLLLSLSASPPRIIYIMREFINECAPFSAILEVIERRGWDDAIFKPAVGTYVTRRSKRRGRRERKRGEKEKRRAEGNTNTRTGASAYGVYRISKSKEITKEEREACEKVLQEFDCLVQPFQPSVCTKGRK